jgi:hypothetical protein
VRLGLARVEVGQFVVNVGLSAELAPFFVVAMNIQTEQDADVLLADSSACETMIHGLMSPREDREFITQDVTGRY